MNLQILAQQYKDFFLDVEYHIYTKSEEIILKGKPNNFLHLTGLQQCLSPRIDVSQFYFDCLNGKYGDIKSLLTRIKDKTIKNKIYIKTDYFSNIQNAILLSSDLFFKDKIDYGICSPFVIGNKVKFHTVLFVYNDDCGFCVPKSNQVDMSKDFSNVIKHNYGSVPITKIEVIKQ